MADFTESSWATCFQETAEQILGIKADDLGELKNSVIEIIFKFFQSSIFFSILREKMKIVKVFV